ncbi:YqeG family HAD IIIA-type phosphatase [Brevibacillus sp. SYP-B805]|uniref:YqeG family HAD IIIA-type phosphatase n=1 Tax=Brevibacillus sp. SYP-B805 TaxID=1578199 RepID=UPI0019D2AF78|nr:YqeG family HAD IIIA-type phosphatase [Brevibacillus sp. SYP-B805]
MGKLMPNEFVESIHHIDPEELKKRKIRGVITDLDNTLVEWNRPDATPEVVEWFRRLRQAGIQVTVVSNNNRERVHRFCEPLEARFIWAARKPLGQAFMRAVRDMNVPIEETVVVGDQLFTDILGGNLLGFHTILVVPVAQTDGILTRFNRLLERIALYWMRRKGMISWTNKS